MSDRFTENLARAKTSLAQFSSKTLRHWIDGEPRDSSSGETFDNHTPVDDSLLGTVASGDAVDVDRAAEAATRAFADWRKMPGGKRRALLHDIADAIEAKAEQIAVVESMDTGQPIRFMAAAAKRGAENFRFFADRAPGARDGLALPAAQHMNYTVRQPIGPVGAITPWNTPFMLSTWKIAPALAAGCTVVHKPAEWSPLSAALLAETCHEAGLPAGVLNTVQGIGERAGVAVTEHEAIKAVAFIGESRTGSFIMAQGARTLKRLHFELGGKNPVVVFDDADLDRALDAAVFMIYSLNGERCTSSSRLLVQDSIYDNFISQVADRIQKIKVGHPLDPTTEIGPLIHPRHVEKVRSYLDIARSEGAEVHTGGVNVCSRVADDRSSGASARTSGDNALAGRAGTPGGGTNPTSGDDGATARVGRTAQDRRDGPNGSGGNYVRPTLFCRARNDMRIAQEEIFGPVLTAIPFGDEAEALRLANGVRYGLAGYVWTGDAGRAHRFAEGLDAGMVWVNSENNRHLPSPFGGMKYSGIGRDGGDYSFDFYMETKNICIAHDTHRVPSLGR